MKGIITTVLFFTFMYFATAIAAKAQWGFGFRPPEYAEGYHRHHSHWRHSGGECRELRAACMHKEELGEEGQGNCRRFRETCG